MEQKKCKITFQKVTAVLCALVALFCLIAFFGGDTTDNTEYLKARIEAKETQIAQNEESIAQRETDITGYQKEKQDAEAALAEAKADLEKAGADVLAAQNAADEAEKNLDAVCTRSYYSSWYCTVDCQSLHTEASNKQTALRTAKNLADDLSDTVYAIENTISRIEGNIQSAQQDITDTQGRIGELEKEIKELKAELTGAWFIVIFKAVAMLMAVAGLALLAKNFYTETQDKFTLYGVAGLAGSALLFWIAGAINNVIFENAPLLYLLLCPHTWTIAVMALLAAILLEKTRKPVVLRNIAVVLSVILAIDAVLVGNAFVCILFAAAMICAAFVIVPLVFTKYIDIAKHIFLSLITFGIWQLVWTYHVTKNLNEVEGVEERKPARELLLCMFLPFYYPFWLYKTAEGVEDYGKENGKEFKIDILCIAFAFVCPLFATVLIQNKINVVAGKPVPAEPKVLEEAVSEEPEVVEAEAVETE